MFEALYDLAGELNPEEMARLAKIETPVIRRLRRQILKCKQRQRRVSRQLTLLLEEKYSPFMAKSPNIRTGKYGLVDVSTPGIRDRHCPKTARGSTLKSSNSIGAGLSCG